MLEMVWLAPFGSLHVGQSEDGGEEVVDQDDEDDDGASGQAEVGSHRIPAVGDGHEGGGAEGGGERENNEGQLQESGPENFLSPASIAHDVHKGVLMEEPCMYLLCRGVRPAVSHHGG